MPASLQARKTESAISGIVRNIIHAMLVAMPVIWQFLGSR
jgi:hypothetical protein